MPKKKLKEHKGSISGVDPVFVEVLDIYYELLAYDGGLRIKYVALLIGQRLFPYI